MSIGRKILLLNILILICLTASFSQIGRLNGIVRDKQSDEPIPFVSVFLKIQGNGILTDSSGRFYFPTTIRQSNDTLVVMNVGYKPAYIPLAGLAKDSAFLNIKLEVLPASKETEVVVKTKYNRSLWFWNRIIKNKYKHDRLFWDNYSYEIYNKLEVDLNNVKQKLGENRLLKPLNFVLIYVDSTSEEKPYLPVYLAETISDYYFQKSPRRVREEMIATKTNGIENESVVKNLGGMYQNINIYNNYIDVFDKQFISPFNDNGDKFYNFKLLDTQYVSNRRLVHLRFTPKHVGSYTFEGDCWVHDTSYAIQKITLRPATDANINFVSGLSMIQEFRLINDTTWFLYKDRFVVDFTPLGGERLGLKGRKTTTYKNVVLNDSSVTRALSLNKLAEEVQLLPNYKEPPDSFWNVRRHTPLDKNEQTVYKVLDTLEKNKTFNLYKDIVYFVTTGTKDFGNVRIGPWYYWLSADGWEGVRTRFDLSTNEGFSKHWYLHGYGAYGFGDGRFKGKAEVKYLINKQPWSYLLASYTKDLDNGQKYYDEIGTDNIFSLAFRRSGIPVKFQQIEEKKFVYYTESNIGIGGGIEINSSQYTPLENIPEASYFKNPQGAPLNSFETTIKLRYAYLERFFIDNFYRTSLGSDYPIIEVKFTKGWPGVMNSSYDYTKISFTISDHLKLGHYGNLYYNVFGGKIYGTVPYPFLEVHPGNEMYYYNRYAFNMMNRYEYMSDEYAGLILEHNIGSGLFKFIPITRKLKFRQFWELRSVIGNLNQKNKDMNFVGNYPFHSLNGRNYLELGTGVDNILKFFRVDFVWRLLPKLTNADPDSRSFGIFGSFRLTL